MSYWRFFAMIGTSTVVMFGLMYLNTYLVSHLFWSETRAYMAVLMGATMAIIMLAFMLSMYANKAVNIAIFGGAVLVFAAALWLVRSQTTVGDTSYMRAMIPHHSIAIMTSSRANISDPRVRKLADEIIYAQDKEIAEMRYLIGDIEAAGDAAERGNNAPARVVSLDEALATAEIAILDPEFMRGEEIAQLFDSGAACVFTYTPDSPPVLALGSADGAGTAALIKISGDLVRLNGDTGGSVFTADGMSLRLAAPNGADALEVTAGDPQEADLILELDAGLRAGYRGFLSCGA